MANKILALFLQAGKEWQKDNAFQKGAAIAFFATFSIAPILIIGISIAGFFFGTESVRQEALERVSGFVGPDGIDFLSGVMQKTFEPSDNFIAITIGLVTLVLGAAGVFFQVKEALSRMWDDYSDKNDGVIQILSGFILPILFVLGVGLLFIAMSLFRTAMTIISKYLNEMIDLNFDLIFAFDYVFSIVLMVAVFMFIYRAFSPLKFEWKYAFGGSLVTAIMLTFSSFIIDIYIGFAGLSVVYGAAGSLAVIMFWIFFMALIFLYGAEVTKVLVINNNKKLRKYARKRGRI